MSPTYTFTGAYPRALFGLSVGVNAEIIKADGSTAPRGSTVEAWPGDTVTTTEPYPHPELTETGPGAPNLQAAPPQPPAPVAPAAPEGFDPAHDAMTAEGAPAPTA